MCRGIVPWWQVWCLAGGPRPKVYAEAIPESVEVKVENNMITFKFRTYLA